MAWDAFLESDGRFHAYEMSGARKLRQLCYEGGVPFRDGIYCYALVKDGNKCLAIRYIQDPWTNTVTDRIVVREFFH